MLFYIKVAVSHFVIVKLKSFPFTGIFAGEFKANCGKIMNTFIFFVNVLLPIIFQLVENFILCIKIANRNGHFQSFFTLRFSDVFRG